MPVTRRSKLLDRKTNVRDAALCVIATEGRHTERQYFEGFGNRKVRVIPLPTGDDNKSAPQHVLKRLDDFKAENDIGPDDALWLMVDVDRWGVKRLKGVCQSAVQKGYRLAVSNPCFELWLYLHHADAETGDTDCAAVETRLRARLGSYNKANLNRSLFLPQAAEAIRRARALDNSPDDRWPDFPGTHVYKVAETLIEPAA